MDVENRWLTLALVCMAACLIYLYSLTFAHAHDLDHPELSQWYSELKQPDNPTASCCGEADGYWCDDYYAKDGRAFCKITDDRVIKGRPPIPVGTEIEIPEWKLKWDRSNPTGHAIVFLSSGGAVYCFVQAGGV